MIPEQTLQRILYSTSLIGVVGEFVKLKRSGTEYLGLCPFHNEKTPSFGVAETKGLFLCRGCGKGGNAFQFLMQIKGIPFRDAVAELAGKLNIEIEDDATKARENHEAEQVLYRRNDELLKCFVGFRDQALESGRLADLVDRLAPMGDPVAIMEQWKIGWCPEDLAGVPGPLRREARRFAGRIIFPIFEPYRGDIAGFAGRQTSWTPRPPHFTPEDKIAKYVNSPDSRVFKKSSLLYRMPPLKRYQSRPQTDRAIVVEGYTDTIALETIGIQACAVMSKSLSSVHARMIVSRIAPGGQIVLMLDGDEAGAKGMEAALPVLLPAAAGRRVRLCQLPLGEDPDSLVRVQAGDVIRRTLDQDLVAPDQFLCSRMLAIASPATDAALDLTDVETLTARLDRAVNYIVSTLDKIEPALPLYAAVLKTRMVTALANIYPIDVESLVAAINRLRRPAPLGPASAVTVQATEAMHPAPVASPALANSTPQSFAVSAAMPKGYDLPPSRRLAVDGPEAVILGALLNRQPSRARATAVQLRRLWELLDEFPSEEHAVATATAVAMSLCSSVAVAIEEEDVDLDDPRAMSLLLLTLAERHSAWLKVWSIAVAMSHDLAQHTMPVIEQAMTQIVKIRRSELAASQLRVLALGTGRAA